MLEGDYIPLSAKSIGPQAWMAWQFVLPDASKSFVQVFRRSNCFHDSAQQCLYGLDASKMYEVQDFGGGSFKASGEQLMREGLSVAILRAPAAKTYQITRIQLFPVRTQHVL